MMAIKKKLTNCINVLSAKMLLILLLQSTMSKIVNALRKTTSLLRLIIKSWLFIDYDKTQLQEHWIIFKSTEAWHKNYCKEGFGHVAVLMRDLKNWYSVDPILSRVKLKNLGEEKPSFEEGWTVVYVTSYLRKNPLFSVKCKLFTCVSFIRYLTGLEIKGFTPYSLYKNLEKIAMGKSKHPSIESVIIVKNQEFSLWAE